MWPDWPTWNDVKNAGKAFVGGVGGTVIGTADNISGASFRSAVAANISDPSIASGWNTGLDVADVGAMLGGRSAQVGGSAMTASAATVTVTSGGLALEGSAPFPLGGLGISVIGTILNGNGTANLASQNGRVNIGEYSHIEEKLPRDERRIPSADGEASGPHSRLGTTKTGKGPQNKAAEFDGKGNAVKEIDFTDHGKPDKHANPHEHPIDPNSTKPRGSGRPLNVDHKRYLPWLKQE